MRKNHLIFAKRILWDELVDREGIHAIIDDAIGSDARQIDETGQAVCGWFDEAEIIEIKRVVEARRDGKAPSWHQRDECIERAIGILKECQVTGIRLRDDFDPEDTENLRNIIKHEATNLANNLAYLGLNVVELMK